MCGEEGVYVCKGMVWCEILEFGQDKEDVFLESQYCMEFQSLRGEFLYEGMVQCRVLERERVCVGRTFRMGYQRLSIVKRMGRGQLRKVLEFVYNEEGFYILGEFDIGFRIKERI